MDDADVDDLTFPPSQSSPTETFGEESATPTPDDGASMNSTGAPSIAVDDSSSAVDIDAPSMDVNNFFFFLRIPSPKMKFPSRGGEGKGDGMWGGWSVGDCIGSSVVRCCGEEEEKEE